MLKKLLFLLLVFCGLYSFNSYYFKKQYQSHSIAQQNDNFSSNFSHIDKIEVSHNNSLIALEKLGQNWELSSPFRWAANHFAIDELFHCMKKSGIPENFQKQIKIYSNGKAISLQDHHKAEGFSPEKIWQSIAKKGIDFWCQKSIFIIPTNQITSVSIKTPSQKEKIFLTSSNGKWRVTSPISTDADENFVKDLLFWATTLEIQGFIQDIEKYSSEVDVKKPELQLAFSGSNKNFAINIWKNLEGSWIAKLPFSKVFFTVPAFNLLDLNRSKFLLPLCATKSVFGDIASISFHIDDQRLFIFQNDTKNGWDVFLKTSSETNLKKIEPFDSSSFFLYLSSISPIDFIFDISPQATSEHLLFSIEVNGQKKFDFFSIDQMFYVRNSDDYAIQIDRSAVEKILAIFPKAN